ncbi:glycosyl hydrolase [Adhaeribacter aerolatus]|uniref:Glycosyl hydrolase n=1 Tax=Adhaeribacter aerolatus TaxID=670289 RepID=A0A512AS07_9BACT|nr:TIGR04283 family arsenosugar biosynthesis glycosyltransferase [Adhaeribacter aerolatus]GEO02476.1 glycosyl hydrolase [Adhaeribacter aerolatus]
MISVIIPTYQEESHIKATLKALRNNDIAGLIAEVIVVDANSQDNTIDWAKSEGAKVVICPKKGRAAQMNYGAALATQHILYFLHADTIPPPGFTQEIVALFNQGTSAGCFRLAFDYPHWFLKANCWFTRFNLNAFRFGDQSLFLAKDKFLAVGGFCEKHLVLEDQHIIKQLSQIGSFKVIKRPVITSARKYLENGIYKTQAIFFLVYILYNLGLSQTKLESTYRKLIRQDKL